MRLDAAIEARVPAFEALLDESERARRARFKAQGAALQHLVGRALVRCSLSLYADVAPEAWRFEPNRYGCPAIAAPAGTDLVFNLSHTDGLVACAVARGLAVGVDVERVERRVEVEKLARYSFAESEAETLLAAPEEARRELFFAYWTLKEAYIKARGMGLALPLDGFAFDVAGEQPTIAFSETCPDDPSAWLFRRARPTPEHRLALAIAHAGRPVEIACRWTVPLDAVRADAGEGAVPL